jgi:hypothetical protein
MRNKTFAPLALAGTIFVAVAGLHAQREPAPQAPSPQQPAPAPARTTARPAAQEPARRVAAAPAPDGALLKQYCLGCHNDRAKVGSLTLESLPLTDLGSHAETWEKVVRKIRTGMMPPSGSPRPAREALDGFAAALEGGLDRAHVTTEHLESPSLHRLNRNEYANAVRDLLEIEVDVTNLLPGDGSTHGFDNIAEGLSVSPTLIQGYVSAAMKISRLAVGDRTLPPSTTTYTAPPALAQDSHIEGLPLGTRGGMLVRHTFPLDAEYEIGAGGRGGGAGADITIDGARATGAAGGRGALRVKVAAGPRVIGAAVLDRQRGAGVDDIYSDFRENGEFTVGGGIPSIVITGPFAPTGPGDTPSRRRIFICHPDSGGKPGVVPASAAAPSRAAAQASATSELGCARKILTTLATRAFRGPVTAAEIDTFMRFYAEGRKDGDFESGIQQGIARILIAPRFVYRIEEEPAKLAKGAVYRISDTELASRLSFFLWSSIPDDELLALAAKNRLREPEVLRQQVKRMIADKRADAFITNFAGQWLYLRELANVQTEAKHFDDNLRQAFRRETEMLFNAIVREDRSVIELLDADYTYVDERLARHYGIPNVRGSHFRRVSWPSDSPRRGLLGHGSMLTVTSVATRTSPVSRGKWILENLFGAPPPEPPPGVETNLEAEPGAKATTLRQRLEMHRTNPVCASCHKIMDPLGFSLENYDLVGAWRERDEGSPIDSTGQLADGTPVAGPTDLRKALLSRSDAFLTTMGEKLLIYALGRPTHHYDMPQVRALARRAAASDNRFSAFVLGVVESDTFQKRVKK